MVASTHEIEYVESGKDASKVKKSFDPRMDLIGELVLLEGEGYRFRFRRAAARA
ncbi:hypothetical protein ACI48D_23440 [Massilia sp. LXY-6]|uniref:hypothetical protein n=1 Tax=Massilia sp. LXY-6 TaxID=3379823 RepID=UPI003EE333F5